MYGTTIASPQIKVTPTDVYAKLQSIANELNSIEQAMGKNKNKRVFITVKDASPREVYFEAEALYKKANRLAFEVTGSYQKKSLVAPEQLSPSDVMKLVEAAHQRLLLVQKRLDITETTTVNNNTGTKTPTDVFNEMLGINQELNELLYHRFAPRDVFEQITLAINYSMQLLKYYHTDSRIPASPQFIKNKRPTDVYQRLIECIQLLKSIAKSKDVKMLSIQVSNKQLRNANPSNVYDLSKIVVAEVRYLNALASLPTNLQSYNPGYKTPSEVFQRTGILLKQLQTLKKAIVTNGKKR